MHQAKLPHLLHLSDFQLRANCPACGSPDASPASPGIRYRKAEDFPIGRVAIGADVFRARRILKCRACTLWYASHILTEAAMKRLTELPSTGGRWQGATRVGYDRSRSVIEQLPPGPRVMDVGAHVGLFLDGLGPGIHKTGLEANAASCLEMQKRGIDTIVGTLESADVPKAGFEAVTALDVLEHFYRPREAVQAVARAVKPGGIFIFETGTTDCMGASLLKDAWYYGSYLEHFQVFNERSLDRLLTSCGFERVTMRKVYHDRLRVAWCASALLRTSAFLLTTGLGLYPSGWERFCLAFSPASTSSPPATGCFERDHIFGVYRRVED